MESDPLDARAALDAVMSAQRRSVELVTSAPWYAPWYGVTAAALPVSIALVVVRSPVGLAVLGLAMVSLTLLAATYRRATRVWPSGQGMLAHIVPAVVAMFGAGFASCALAASVGLGSWLIAVAVLTAVVMALLSRSYDRAYARKHGGR